MMKTVMIAGLVFLLLAGCAPAEPVEAEVPTAPFAAELTVPPAQPAQLQTLPPTEAATERPEPDDMDLVRVVDFIPNIRQSLAYATENNFVGQAVYDFADAYLRYGTVKKLKAASGELEQLGLGILIWDGFRPLAAQEKLWEICPDPTYVSHPVTGSRSHCRGSAVDLTLIDLKTGEMLTMPTGFDDFTALADRDYSDCSAEAANNARMLEEVMVKHGFKPYRAEWWHYSDTDEYPVDETFLPEQTVFEGGVG